MNDFQECLAESHAAHDLPLWREVYEHAFPTMVAMHCHRADGDHQRVGIDRSVVLDTGKTLWVDEKVRGRNKKTGKVYDDIALEYVSNNVRRTPGWVCKPLMCDYIAYAIAPLGKAYLMPVPALQAAWLRNADEWIDKHARIVAQNNGYQTISVGVPANTVFRCIGSALRVEFQSCELDDDVQPQARKQDRLF